ncbi:MAG: GDP-mannose 4,6-dehydratase [Candidatus Thermoplasmatota archaeon]|nr:GDP-mannose 4,6-dehydratase [Candidatus Thermoplasmatota archaeon]
MVGVGVSEGKSVLITGVDGFIGTHLSRALIEGGDRVTGLIRKGLGITNRDDRIRYLEGELLDPGSMERVISSCEPDVIYHLAAQTFVPRSFSDPLETYGINFTGTANLLEAIRKLDLDPVVLFSSSAEEYGLVYSSEEQYRRIADRYSSYRPPLRIPELPVSEDQPLRPLSPYGLSKMFGTSLMRSYHSLYGVRTVVARNFNIEGPGRGGGFVTSRIIDQLLDRCPAGISIGNVNIFKDWSHVEDVISAHRLLVEKGSPGQVYNVGSERANSVLTFILLAVSELGMDVEAICSMENGKSLDRPLEEIGGGLFGRRFTVYRVDKAVLGPLSFDLEDKGITVRGKVGKLRITFDAAYFRPHDNPVIMADTSKVRELGFQPTRSLADIVAGQIEYAKSRRETRRVGRIPVE